ncbi:hypothetical protein JXM67_06465 [candidate division WOR-3 bacterium]|nr:hypothetical protein [candidate division WOR-3 bacterium]
MDRKRVEELQKLYASWSNEELIQAVKNEPEALRLIKEELHKRNILKRKITPVERKLKKTVISGWIVFFMIILWLELLWFFMTGWYLSEISFVFYILGLSITVYGIVTFIFLLKKNSIALKLVKI